MDIKANFSLRMNIQKHDFKATNSAISSNSTTILAPFRNATIIRNDDEKLIFMYDMINIIAIATFCTGFPPNIIIIYIISTVRKLRSPINRIVMSLAVADCIYLLWYLLSVIDQVHNFIPSGSDLFIYFYSSVDMFMASASIINVAALSVDRLTGCWYPLRYESLMIKKAPRIICFSWIYSITFGLIAFLRIAIDNKDYQEMVFYGSALLSFALPVLTVIVSYSFILVCAHLSIKRTKNLHGSVNLPQTAELMGGDVSNSQSTLNLQRRKNKGFLREFKVTMTILIIVVPFTFGWAFYVGVQVYEHFNKIMIKNVALNVIFNITPSVVSAFNPYIYFMLSKSFRHALRRKICMATLGNRYHDCYCYYTKKSTNKRHVRSSSVQMQVISSTSYGYSTNARGSVGGASGKQA